MTRNARKWAVAGTLAALLAAGCGDSEQQPLSPNGASGKAERDDCRDGEGACTTAVALCQKLVDGTVDVQSVGGGTVVTKDNWKTIDVIANMDYRQCHDAIDQEKIEVDGQVLWQFRSVEDHCDGGNTYGAIYTEDLKTAVAHIYDSDIYCDGWRPEDLAENHKCDVGAELFARQKMEAFGFAFEELDSYLTLRDPYIYSYIDVTGALPDYGDREATVRVLANIDSCTYTNPSIVNLRLDL